ncbi:MAG: hypothetical protein AB3N28_01960, partial [Kordiimonas sp.]
MAMGDFQSSKITNAEKIARVRLIRTNKIGPATFQRLLQTHGSAVSAIDFLETNQPELAVYSYEKAISEFDALHQMDGDFLFLGDATYPERLVAIADAPPVLAIKGKLELASARII